MTIDASPGLIDEKWAYRHDMLLQFICPLSEYLGQLRGFD